MGQECFDMFGPWSTCGSSIICQEGSLSHSHHLGQGPGGHLDSVRFGASNMTSSQSINRPLNMWTKRKLPFSGLEHAVLMKWEFFFFPSSSNIYCLDMIALPSSKNTKNIWKIHHLEIIFKGKTINFYSLFCVFTGGHVHPWKRRQPGWSSAVCSQRLWPPDREVRALDVGWLQLDGNLLFYLDKGYEITNVKSSYWDRQGIGLYILYN